MWPPPKGLYLDENFNTHHPQDLTHGHSLGPELDEIFPQHFREFPPQSPLITLMFALSFTILTSLSIFGNLIIMYVFMKAERLRTVSNLFVINLVFSDMMMMATHGLPVMFNMFTARYWIWGVFNCGLYASSGGIVATVSILTMVVIGYDRCNIISGGISAKRISKGKAVGILILIWTYAILSAIGPFFGWGRFSLEGFLVTCSYDYVTKDWKHKSYLLYALISHYCIPLALIIFYYARIVKAVVSHENELKAQAKKMGVDSLKQKKEGEDSAEMKIAKVAVTNVLLYYVTWTPYVIITALGFAGQYHLITPLVSGIPSFITKTGSAWNPIVFALSHPVFRESLGLHCPCFGIGVKKEDPRSGGQGTEAVQA